MDGTRDLGGGVINSGVFDAGCFHRTPLDIGDFDIGVFGGGREGGREGGVTPAQRRFRSRPAGGWIEIWRKDNKKSLSYLPLPP